MTDSKPALRIRLGHMVTADVPACARINADNAFPWIEDEFLRALRQRTTLGMVAHSETGILGFCVYRVEARVIDALNFAVDLAHRRRGVGTAMANRLLANLTTHRCQVAVVHARESNLGAHLFLRDVGFMAERIRPAFYPDGETSYEFACRVPGGEAGK